VSERLLTDVPEFYQAVHALRRLSERNRHLALYASLYWDNATIAAAERQGLVRPDDDGLPPARMQ
jgi:hypothetical protein